MFTSVRQEKKDFEVKGNPPLQYWLLYLYTDGPQANAQTQQVLVQILERDAFGKRVNIHGITEYAVVELTQQEVSENFRKREKGKEMDELPF